MIMRKIWRDSWFRKLPERGRTLWLYLLTAGEDISRSGLMELDIDVIAFHSMIPVEEVVSLLDLFCESGKVYREGQYLLIKNFMAYQCYNATLLISCRTEIEQWRERCPSLVDAAEEILDQLQGEKKPISKELTPAQQELVPLAEKLIAIIHEKCANGGGREPDNDLQKSVAVIEQIHRIDKIPGEDIERTAVWMLDDDFWKGVMLAIPYWRKVSKQNGRPKFCNAWSAWRAATGQSAKGHGRGGSDWSAE